MTPHVHHWLIDPPDRAAGGLLAARCTVRGCPAPRRTFSVHQPTGWEPLSEQQRKQILEFRRA